MSASQAREPVCARAVRCSGRADRVGAMAGHGPRQPLCPRAQSDRCTTGTMPRALTPASAHLPCDAALTVATPLSPSPTPAMASPAGPETG